MTREEMLARMSLPEFQGWKAYDRVFGLGDNLEILATLCTMVARAAGNAGAKPGDFAPYFKAGRPEQTPEEMLAMFLGNAVVTHG